MKKREVTNAMVERACRAHWGKRLWGDNGATAPRLETATPRHNMQAALEAALNPPPEPEVTVTDEMKQAGVKATPAKFFNLTNGMVAEIYRAMRRLEPGSRGAYAPEDARQEVFANTVAVGFPLGRTDGLTTLHVGTSVAYLDYGEAMKLASDLESKAIAASQARK